MHSESGDRPAPVTVIAVVFIVASAYLVVLGLIMLASPGTVSMAAGSELLGGLETWGPYMFLLAGGIGLLIASGLMRMSNFARRAASLVAMAGVVLLVPRVSGAVVSLHFSTLFISGCGIVARVIIAFYLYQQPTREAFERRPVSDY
jgi:hypothetical protein